MELLGPRFPNRIRLYLDDQRKCPVGWTLARSVAEAVRLSLEYTVAEASLDHDLGACGECLRTVPEAARTLGCPHVPSGMEYLRWCHAADRWPLVPPRVHSLNVEGGAAMRAYIAEHYRGPEEE